MYKKRAHAGQIRNSNCGIWWRGNQFQFCVVGVVLVVLVVLVLVLVLVVLLDVLKVEEQSSKIIYVLSTYLATMF